jgi:hypothetical protein
MTNGDHEPERRVLGIPLEPGEWRPKLDPAEQRVLGVPRSWLGPREPLDMRGIRHPIRWLRWRSEVRKRGAYAPRYEDFRREN